MNDQTPRQNPCEELAEARRGFRRTGLALTAALLLTLLLQLPAWAGGPAPGSRGHELARLIWPQGWNLFDNGQRAPELVAYRTTPAGWTSAMATPHSTPRGLWGADRSSRTQAREIEALAALVPATAWTRCDTADPADCHDPAPPAPIPLHTPAARPTLCGPVALTRQQLTPWGRQPAGQWRVTAAVTLTVSCP